jgi:hypothetical protein
MYIFRISHWFVSCKWSSGPSVGSGHIVLTPQVKTAQNKTTETKVLQAKSWTIVATAIVPKGRYCRKDDNTIG